MEEEEGGVVKEREAVEQGVITKLTSPCLEELHQALASNRWGSLHGVRWCEAVLVV